jgi:hypothetical protein
MMTIARLANVTCRREVRLSRREILKSAARCAGAAAIGGPCFVHARVFGAPAPTNRINFGEFKTLPVVQLAEVLTSQRRSDLFIGGCLDRATESLTLVRGDLNLLTVPLRIFRTRGATKPDFKQFDVDDYGYSIRFGAYEASADKVLYEADPEYRRRFNAQRPATEQGFGPSLKRLRILRQLSRDEFPGVPERSIASLERESAVKPKARTLNALAKTLQVDPEEIETY